MSSENHEEPDVVNLSEFMDIGGSRALKFVTLNTCGVLSKLKFSEFLDFVNTFDVICLVETKLDSYDSFQIDGFNTYTMNRNSKKGVRCGGIAILIRCELCKHVDILKGTSSDAVWFKIKRPLVKNDIICGGIYVSPEGSRYCSLDCFDTLETDLIAFATEHENADICLIGDFNARTSNLDDTLSIDENIFQNLNLYTDIVDNSYKLNDFIPGRVSCDKKANNYGYRLIEFCKSFDIHILNGPYEGG